MIIYDGARMVRTSNEYVMGGVTDRCLQDNSITLHMSKLWAIKLFSWTAVALGACSSQAVTEAEYIQLVASIFESHETNLGLQDPLHVDLQSFAQVGQELTGAKIEPNEIRRAVGRSFEDVDGDRAVQCDTSDDCWIRGGGRLHVRLDSIKHTRAGLDVHATSIVPHRYGLEESVCDRSLEIQFIRRGEQWESKGLTTMVC